MLAHVSGQASNGVGRTGSGLVVRDLQVLKVCHHENIVTDNPFNRNSRNKQNIRI
jgi:hypothetical protein